MENQYGNNVTIQPMYMKTPSGYVAYIHEQRTPLLINRHYSQIIFKHARDAQAYALQMVHDSLDTGVMQLPETN